MRSKKRSFLMSLTSLILCVAMLVGSTFAWFTDTVTSGNNRIVAGNLDIDFLMDKGNGYVSIAGGTGDIFKEANIATNSNATLWEPGKTQFAKLAVENKGNLAVKYTAYIDVKDNGLADSLECALVTAKAPISTDGYNNWAAVKAAVGESAIHPVTPGRNTIATGVLDEILKGTQNERDYVLLAVHMKEEAGNEYQGKDAIIDVTIVATQKDAEKDVFGPDYDESAEGSTPDEPIHEAATGETGNVEGGNTKLVTAGSETAPSVEATIPTAGKGTSGAGNQFKAVKAIEAGKTEESNGVVLYQTDDETGISSKLTLNVDQEATTRTSVTYEITMNAVVTKTQGGATVETKNYQIKELSEYTTATIQIGPGKKEVKVKHSNVDMTGVEDVETYAGAIPEAGIYSYNEATGNLAIKTKTFSPFEVSYTIVVEPEVRISKMGTEDSYMTLAAFRDSFNSGDDYTGSTITLIKNVDLKDVAWTPIGIKDHPFNGTFDGDNHTVSNLTVNGYAENSNLGLFGQVVGAKNDQLTQESDVWENYEFKDEKFAEANYTAVLKNIHIENFDLNNTSNSGLTRYTGALAGQTVNAYIENITVASSVIKGTKGIGGIVGSFDGSTAINCKTLAEGTGVLVESTTGGYNTGGLFGGVNYAKTGTDLSKYCAVIDCENNANVIVATDGASGGNAGGITGMSQGGTGGNDRSCIYYHCVNNGDIDYKASGADRIGGIAGSTINVVAVINCVNNGNVKATSASAMAGIAGKGCGTMINCINNGNVEGAAMFMSGIHTDDVGNSGGSSVAIGCANNGILNNTSTDPAAQTSNISAKSREIVITDQIFENTGAVNAVLADHPNVTNIIFKNCSVQDPTGTLAPSGIQSHIESDKKIADSIVFNSVSEENNYITINVPDLTTELGTTLSISQFSFMGSNNTVNVAADASIQQLTVSGDRSNATVKGNVNLLRLGGTGNVNAEITETGACDRVGFSSTGTYVLTNKGTISHTQSDSNQYANEHTVSTVFYASNITIHNHGKIAAKKNNQGINSYSCLFYGGCTVDVHNYYGSSIEADNGSVLACGSAQSVTYYYYDEEGKLTETKKMK